MGNLFSGLRYWGNEAVGVFWLGTGIFLGILFSLLNAPDAFASSRTGKARCQILLTPNQVQSVRDAQNYFNFRFLQGEINGKQRQVVIASEKNNFRKSQTHDAVQGLLKKFPLVGTQAQIVADGGEATVLPAAGITSRLLKLFNVFRSHVLVPWGFKIFPHSTETYADSRAFSVDTVQKVAWQIVAEHGLEEMTPDQLSRFKITHGIIEAKPQKPENENWKQWLKRKLTVKPARKKIKWTYDGHEVLSMSRGVQLNHQLVDINQGYELTLTDKVSKYYSSLQVGNLYGLLILSAAPEHFVVDSLTTVSTGIMMFGAGSKVLESMISRSQLGAHLSDIAMVYERGNVLERSISMMDNIERAFAEHPDQTTLLVVVDRRYQQKLNELLTEVLELTAHE